MKSTYVSAISCLRRETFTSDNSLSKTLPEAPRRDEGWTAGTRESDTRFKDTHQAQNSR